MCPTRLWLTVGPPYLPGEPCVRRSPHQDVGEQERRHAYKGRQQDVAQGEKHGNGHDGDHCRALPHPDGEQLVVDVVPVGQERIAPVP